MRPANGALIAWFGAAWLGLAPALAQTAAPTPAASSVPAKPAEPAKSAEPAKPALTPSKPGAKAYFVDLKDGATIAPTTTIHFGLSGMGVAPAGVARPNSGHFHLLIDEDTPPLDEPIPSNDNSLHFGAGQTETTLTLAPGKHTLQLLMGDANHIPHSPPVMSPIIHVTVAEPAPTPAPAAAATTGRHPSPKGARVYIEAPSNGAYVPTTFTVRFGLVGMGVAPAGVDRPNSGHHHLIVDSPLPPFDQPIPNDENHLHFGAGQTEASVTLPKGKHTLQLLLADGNHIPHDPPVYSQPIVVYVGMAPPAPHVVAPHVVHHPRHHVRRRYWGDEYE
jgi:hypothetical protein